MKIKEYKDGLAFIQDDDEIAFYSNITDRICYSNNNGYKDFITIDCSSIPYKDNLKIIEEIKRYKRALESGMFND